MHRDTYISPHLLVQQHVNLREESDAEVGRQNVSRRHQNVFADRDTLGRASEQQLNHAPTWPGRQVIGLALGLGGRVRA